MQEIIKKSLSDLLDKLLKQAFDEKPDLITKHSFTFNHRFSVCIIDVNLYDITIAVKKNIESMGNHVSYVYDLTNYQKEMIDKILNKWRNNGL